MKTFQDAIRSKEFALLGQLRLHQDCGRKDVLEQAATLAPAVDAISVTDNPHGVLHMSGLAVAALLIEQGIDPVLQFSARDRNRLALKSELLGAAALGVTSLVLQRGNRLPTEGSPKVKQIFDTGAKKFLASARQLSEFQKSRGDRELFLGTMATVFDPEEDWKPAELSAKIQAGAQFVQTQACLDVELLRRYMEKLVASRIPWRCQVIVSLPVLTSVDSARWLKENTRGSIISEDLIQQFQDTEDPRAFGISHSAHLIKAVREIPGVRGVNLSTLGELDAIVEAIQAAE